VDPSLDHRVHDLLGEAHEVILAIAVGHGDTSRRDDLLTRLRLCEEDARGAGKETSAYDLREAIKVLESATILESIANTHRIPLCPKCGKVPEETARQLVLFKDFVRSPDLENKRMTVVTYRCSSCGATFDEPESPVRSLPPSSR